MKSSSTKEPAVSRKTRVITLKPRTSGVFNPSLTTIRRVGINGNPGYITVLNQRPGVNSLPFQLTDPESAMRFSTARIPRPPNAFMIFANEWRKKLALEHPSESNKSISVRLGQLWKQMGQDSKEPYFELSRKANREHKQKYPGYVYNPKVARMRKALREQSKGARSSSSDSQAITRWPEIAVTMNYQRQSQVSPVVLSQQQSKFHQGLLVEEQVVDGDTNMLQSYPDYLDLPYNTPSTDYSALDSQSWYPYLQPGSESNGGYMGRSPETKLPVDWSTPYNSEQGNFISASPQNSPYSMQTQQEVPPLLMNGEHSSEQSNCLASDCKPVLDQLVCQNSVTSVIKDPEQQVKELLASAKVIPENSPVLNGGSDHHTDPNSTRLPGFHQAFGSTEIGRFSQPDGFFEAAVAAENERKSPCVVSEYSLSPSSTFSSSTPPPELFGSHFSEPNHLYTLDHLYDLHQQTSEVDQTVEKCEGGEFDVYQDLSGVGNIGKPPVIISETNNCCVVQLESSSINDNVKEYFSL